MRPRRLAVVAALVLLAVPLVLAGALWFVATTDIARRYAEAAVERATGHALNVGGRVRVVPSLVPTLAADDVALLNPTGFSGPYILHARRVEARVALLPLLRGAVEVRTLRLIGPDAKLEVNAAGRGNWERSPPSAIPSTAPGRRLRLVVSVRRVEVLNGAVAWSGPGAAFRLNVPTLTADLGPSGAPLLVSATADSQGASARLQGTLADPAALRGLDAAVSARVADLAALVPGAPALRDAALTARVTDPDGLARGVALGGLSVTSPQGDVFGDLAVSWRPRPALRGALRSKRLDADAVLALLRERPAAQAPTPAAPPGPAPARARLIPDTPVPVAGLRAADAELSYGADTLRLGGTDFHAAQAGVHLANGVLRLDPFAATSPGGPLNGRATLDAAAGPPRLSAALAAPSLDLGAFLPGASGKAGVNADLSGQGATWRAVAASLGGEADVTAVDGQMDLGRLGALGDALRRAGVPAALSGQARLRCLAVRATASGGVAALGPVLLDAGKLGLRGEGQANLGDETLDLHLRATLRAGPAEAEVPVRVAGSFAAPTVEAERVAGRFSLSIAGAVSGDDPCGPALAAARGGRPGPEPAPLPAQPRAASPADLLRGLLR